MAEDLDVPTPRFEPLRPAPRTRLLAAFVLGPLMWLAAFAVLAVVVERTDAIAAGFLVTVASFVIALATLGLLHVGRQRQRRDARDR
jgi:hypothetical protein